MNLKTYTSLFFFVLLMVGFNDAVADQKSNLHVLRVFSEDQTTGGFYTTENILADCTWGLMYVDLTNPAGRAQFALLLQAKAQGLKLSRVDYTKNPAGTAAGICTANGIHME